MKKLVQNSLEYGQLLISILLASVGLKAFLLPNNFLDGGVTGIAILVNTAFGWNTSLTLILTSIPFLVVGYYTVSNKILFKSIICIVGLSLALEFESFKAVTEDKILIAFFGGGFLGAGIGLAIRNGTVLDGSELLGVFLNNRYGFSISKIILFFNLLLFTIATIYIPIETVLFSILTYFVTSKVIDVFIAGFEDFIGITIISNKSHEIEASIHQNLGVGMTIYDHSTGYGKKGVNYENRVIQTVINRIDIRKLEQIVLSADANAFIMEYDVNTVKGGILRRLFKLNA